MVYYWGASPKLRIGSNRLIFIQRKNNKEKKGRQHGHWIMCITWDCISELVVTTEVGLKRRKGAGHVSREKEPSVEGMECKNGGKRCKSMRN